MSEASHFVETGYITKTLKAGGLAFLASAALAPPVSADPNKFSIIRGTESTPYAGTGAWGTTGPSNLVDARLFNDDTCDISKKSDSGNYVQCLTTDAVTGIKQCEWVEDNYIDWTPGDTENPDNACRDYLYIKDDKSAYAKQVNVCPTGVGGKCVGGTKIQIDPNCGDLSAWGKFAPAAKAFDNVDYPKHGSGPFRPEGKITTDYVYFRWTRNMPDDQGRFYSMVSSDEHNWVWVRRKCLQMSFKKAPVGGPPKTQDTVAGQHPNAHASSYEDYKQQINEIGKAVVSISKLVPLLKRH